MLNTKEKRIYIRLDAETKKLVTRAAQYANETMSSFIRRVAAETARKIITENEILHLSVKDSIAFLDALDNPPAPNEALKKAATRYRRISGL